MCQNGKRSELTFRPSGRESIRGSLDSAGRWSEGNKTCLCGLSSQPILPLGLTFNSSLQVSQRSLIEEASVAAFTPSPLGKAASRCKVVYLFRWIVLVSLANVEKVPSSLCCSKTRKSLYSGSWLRHQNQPDCYYTMGGVI